MAAPQAQQRRQEGGQKVDTREDDNLISSVSVLGKIDSVRQWLESIPQPGLNHSFRVDLRVQQLTERVLPH